MHYHKEIINNITFYRVENSADGRCRYVCHFLNFDTDYQSALKKAKLIKGKAYRARWYGGGIVFNSCNLFETSNFINEIKTV